mgnify:CR=1 FL=1
MRILLNFIPLKSGGGLQIGLDFIAQAKKLGGAHHWFVVASNGTPFESMEPTANVSLARLVGAEPAKRLWFEYVECRSVIRKLKPDVVYTQFGNHWPGAKVPHVIGCAYSNLMYPEMDFWDAYPARQRFTRRLIDRFRRHRLIAADEVVFETQDLAERAIRYLGLDPKRVHTVRPSVSSLVQPGQTHEETAARCSLLPPGYRLVLISGFQLNKNIMLLPRIAERLRNHHGMEDVVFVTTLPPDHPGTLRYLDKAEEQGVGSMVFNMGPVPQQGCAEVYAEVDAVILPTRLESFSNTIAEAWSMRKPLLISDLDWSRGACGDGAIYFGYDDPEDAARKIVQMRRDATAVENLIDAGTAMLATYSTSEQRFLEYLSIIESRHRREIGDDPADDGSVASIVQATQ